ncbi:MAG: exodeoxyribonuclease VII small subunit [Spirochaetales bacterium]
MSKKSDTKRTDSFEKRLERLEELADKVRDPETGLENATKYFEEGVKLARGLEKDLSQIERKVEILVNEPGEDGEKPVLELFPELSEAAGGVGESSDEDSDEP